MQHSGKGSRHPGLLFQFESFLLSSFTLQALKGFSKGDFLVEYAGELIDMGTAMDLEVKYSWDASKGSYMYYFKHEGYQYW